MKTVITAFEDTIISLGKQNQLDKIAFQDPEYSLSYRDLQHYAKSLATAIIPKTSKNEVVGIATNRGIYTIIAMLACMYAGTPYVVIDVESPIERIEKIMQIASPKLLIFDEANVNRWIALDAYPSIVVQSIYALEIDEQRLEGRAKEMISTDPVYILFTSGSTGTPKGTVIHHQNIVNYIEWFITCFGISDKTRFASQTPFYFSMSVSDVFATLFTGAFLYIVPKSYFTFPIKLFDVMNQMKINTIYWVPSAYQMIAQMKVLDYVLPQHLQFAMFAGEVMPTKVLNYWMDKLPQVSFANLFGPTETTDICTYYKVNRRFANDEVLPIGKACENLEVFLINDKGELATPKEEGELYVKGAFVASGYYQNPEKTKEAFVQNPLNPYYPEMVYKTGDLCKYNTQGELVYLCRKDFQIKHMGYRIELGEIEAGCNALEEIKTAFCLYNGQKDEIICCYVGKITQQDLNEKLQAKMPYYMIPQRYELLSHVKLNQNGKIDRKYYQEEYILKK
ncbi:MAG: amino acid adenylation domain-containing protein [Anaeroplasma bactoclasticum]|nr:amino acid adenylation domain-containing protein [Anaeroplasma bactoclasticum]